MSKKYEYGVALTGRKGIDESHVRVFTSQEEAEKELAKCGDGHCLVKREVAKWEEQKKLKFGFPKMVHVNCRMVKVGDVTPTKALTKTEMKNRIECGEWYFPCESYKYTDIKKTLEEGICEILGLESVSVKDFHTDIVEYD